MCDNCDSLNIEDLKENIFQDENVEENIISKGDLIDDVVDEHFVNDYIQTVSDIPKEKKVAKRKGVKRKTKNDIPADLNCDECPFIIKKRKKGVAELTEHLEKVHQKVLPFQCD